MGTQDVRWIQRFHHYQKALAQLERAVKLAQERPLSELEQQGLIQAFEYTHELAWNLLKDFLESRGIRNLYGSRDATREAYKRGLIANGDVWMKMIESRNLTSHTYNESVATQIAQDVCQTYYPEFEALRETMHRLELAEGSE
ncbi:MAG: nucleotidyltransferase substrate binding protein [Chthonomonadetes bacterium]|nr:nucleotidyltransferase substrate binding protein [Chthonomonadetes bacterium]